MELSSRQHEILEFVNRHVDAHGYPPTVREIGQAVGLTSPSTVHAHLARLESAGLIRRDRTKPRALEVMDGGRRDRGATAVAEERRANVLPLVGDVAAGTGLVADEQIEDMVTVPDQLCSDADFLLTVKGDSMVDAGILDGDFVVVRQQEIADPGDTVVAGLPGEEATVKTFLRRRGKVVLRPENAAMDEMVFDPAEITIYGKVVSLLRRF